MRISNYRRVAVATALSVGTAIVALPAFAADNTQHLRGQITQVSENGFTLKTEAGQQREITLSSNTGIAAVTQGDLSTIEKGTFIGTANVERDGQNQALEMVIFPPSMKGTGLGDYAWDLSPSMVNQSASSNQSAQAEGSQTASGSSMTNGTVSSKTSSSMNSGSMTSGSSMTNGTVSSKTSGQMSGDSSSMSGGSSMTNGTVEQQSGGGDMITLQVDYGDGSKTIVVPADVPTVKVQPGERSDLKQGAHVFVAGPQANGPFAADKVIVGKNGIVPPM